MTAEMSVVMSVEMPLEFPVVTPVVMTVEKKDPPARRPHGYAAEDLALVRVRLEQYARAAGLASADDVSEFSRICLDAAVEHMAAEYGRHECAVNRLLDTALSLAAASFGIDGAKSASTSRGTLSASSDDASAAQLTALVGRSADAKSKQSVPDEHAQHMPPQPLADRSPFAAVKVKWQTLGRQAGVVASKLYDRATVRDR